jgi:hypothetical protein
MSVLFAFRLAFSKPNPDGLSPLAKAAIIVLLLYFDITIIGILRHKGII